MQLFAGFLFDFFFFFFWLSSIVLVGAVSDRHLQEPEYNRREKFEMLQVNGKHIRFIHFPDNLDIAKALRDRVRCQVAHGFCFCCFVLLNRKWTRS
jgi:calcineurin-like phosphoesterase family protein